MSLPSSQEATFNRIFDLKIDQTVAGQLTIAYEGAKYWGGVGYNNIFHAISKNFPDILPKSEPKRLSLHYDGCDGYSIALLMSGIGALGLGINDVSSGERNQKRGFALLTAGVLSIGLAVLRSTSVK